MNGILIEELFEIWDLEYLRRGKGPHPPIFNLGFTPAKPHHAKSVSTHVGPKPQFSRIPL
jgi:hypothetical protein